MLAKKLLYLTVLIGLMGAGCGEIRNSSRTVQALDTVLTAGVGDTIIEINTEESMPNIVGKADLFGRTRPTGKVFVTYLGLTGGRAVFERHTIKVQSNATVMNSTPTIIGRSSTTSYSGNTSVYGAGGAYRGNAVTTGTATTTAPSIVLPPSGSTTQVLSNDRVRYFLDAGGVIVVEGHQISVTSATPAAVRYRIQKMGN